MEKEDDNIWRLISAASVSIVASPAVKKGRREKSSFLI
jgi:hypothetical protein